MHSLKHAHCRALGVSHHSIAMFVQVLHGASNDVMWLQRDFRVYIVNVLDTAACCQVGDSPLITECQRLHTCVDVR